MKKSTKGIILGVIVLCLGIPTAIVVSAKEREAKQDRKITITLSEQEWNVVVNALQELPMKVAAPVVSNIMQQAQVQLQSQQKPVVNKGDSTNNKKKP